MSNSGCVSKTRCYKSILFNFKNKRIKFKTRDYVQYVGKWYEIQRFKFVLEEELRCITAEYSIIDSSTVKVNNSGIEVLV